MVHKYHRKNMITSGGGEHCNKSKHFLSVKRKRPYPNKLLQETIAEEPILPVITRSISLPSLSFHSANSPDEFPSASLPRGVHLSRFRNGSSEPARKNKLKTKKLRRSKIKSSTFTHGQVSYQCGWKLRNSRKQSERARRLQKRQLTAAIDAVVKKYGLTFPHATRQEISTWGLVGSCLCLLVALFLLPYDRISS